MGGRCGVVVGTGRVLGFLVQEAVQVHQRAAEALPESLRFQLYLLFGPEGPLGMYRAEMT